MSLNAALMNLFQIDQRLRGLASRLDGAGRLVNVQQTKADQLTRQRDELRTQLKQTQAAAASMETDVQSAEERVEHLREQMNSVKTNKEYSALLIEVNTLKADKSKTEEQALELLSQTDAMRTEVESLEQHLAEVMKVGHAAEQQLNERQAEVGDRLAEVQAQRKEAAAKVAPEALAVFERLADGFDGEALAPVHQDDPRRMEYTCGGCYMQIPMEKVNLLMRDHDLVRCTSCGRILYIEQEMKTGMGVR